MDHVAVTTIFVTLQAVKLFFERRDFVFNCITFVKQSLVRLLLMFSESVKISQNRILVPTTRSQLITDASNQELRILLPFLFQGIGIQILKRLRKNQLAAGRINRRHRHRQLLILGNTTLPSSTIIDICRTFRNHQLAHRRTRCCLFSDRRVLLHVAK